MDGLTLSWAEANLWLFTIVPIVGVLAFAVGHAGATFRCRAEVARCAGKALAAKIALAKVVPALEAAQGFVLGEDEARTIDAALHVARANLWGSGRYYRHLKRGTYYEVLTNSLHLQSSNLGLLHDGAELTLYIDTRSGRLSARHPAEFHDGRFRPVPRTEALDADAIAEQRRFGHRAPELGPEGAGPGYVDQG